MRERLPRFMDHNVSHWRKPGIEAFRINHGRIYMHTFLFTVSPFSFLRFFHSPFARGRKVRRARPRDQVERPLCMYVRMYISIAIYWETFVAMGWLEFVWSAEPRRLNVELVEMFLLSRNEVSRGTARVEEGGGLENWSLIIVSRLSFLFSVSVYSSYQALNDYLWRLMARTLYSLYATTAKLIYS